MRIEFDRSEFDRAYALVREWQQRAAAVRRQFLFRVVSEAYETVSSNLPSGQEDLRQSLRVERIRGLSEGRDGYVIRSVPRRRTVTGSEGESVVIYVAAKDHLMLIVPQETRILEQFGPWTFDTLPYPPDPKTADVISRRVSPREVARVRKLRKRDRPVWLRRIKESGIRELRRGFKSKLVGISTLPDMAFESLRSEFGLGGSPFKSHWRKAILPLAQRGEASVIARRRVFKRAMTDPTFRGWRAWPDRVRGFVTVAEARRYVPFQKRLGIRVGGG